MIVLRLARRDEAEKLTDMCLRSKAVWGYDEAFMKACRTELKICAADFDHSSLCVAVDADTVIGVAQLALDGEEAHLHKLFVEPSAIRTGAGARLLNWAITVSRQNRAKRLWIESDPDAADFYRKMGAIDEGFAPSGSIPGRVLPRLKISLE